MGVTFALVLKDDSWTASEGAESSRHSQRSSTSTHCVTVNSIGGDVPLG